MEATFTLGSSPSITRRRGADSRCRLDLFLPVRGPLQRRALISWTQKPGHLPPSTYALEPENVGTDATVSHWQTTAEAN